MCTGRRSGGTETPKTDALVGPEPGEPRETAGIGRPLAAPNRAGAGSRGPGSGSASRVLRCCPPERFFSASLPTWNTGSSPPCPDSPASTTAARPPTETSTCAATPGGRSPSWWGSTVSGPAECLHQSASSLRPVCTQSASSRGPVCVQSVPSLRPVCTQSASSLHPVRAQSAPSPRPVCTQSTPSLFPVRAGCLTTSHLFSSPLLSGLNSK